MTGIILTGGALASTGSLKDSVLAKVANRPFLHWIAQWVYQQGYQHIVLPTAEKTAPQLCAFAEDFQRLYPEAIVDVLPEGRPLGTAGACAACAHRFPAEDYLVVNGDALVPLDLRPVKAKLRKNPKLDGALVGVNIPNAGRYGTLSVGLLNRLKAFHEKRSRLERTDWVNAGIYLLKGHLLSNLMPQRTCALEIDCFPEWLAQGRHFHVIKSQAPFLDIETEKTFEKTAHYLSAANH